jgi:tetratricopeptide (TPR) repeat protein
VEAGILYYTIKGLINQQFPEAIQGILASLQQQPENKLLLFLGTNLLMKDARSEEALGFIKTLDQQTSGLPLHYIDYLHAEILLQKGEYDRAISHYLRFAAAYRSENFKKDAYYKISLAHWLNGNTDHAKRYFEKARKTGRSVAEPDRVAAAQLEEGRLPNAKLAKVRLATDGGYYTEARKLIDQIKLSDLTSLKEQAEYYYRKARLEHRTGNLAGAKVLYDQTISMAGQQPWYFAANASLQMGYICMDEKRFADAETYFNRALAYKKHEYKTSIDGKARSALETLKAKKLA